MAYSLGATSNQRLEGVNGDLIKVVRLAITMTNQDFMVYEGLRTLARQKELLRQGFTRTLDSYHIKGQAVDLVPFIGRVPKWDWGGCYEIALAMDAAATKLKLASRITWGGDWRRTLADYGGDSARAYAKAVIDYCAAHPGKDFIDGPHFQIAT